MKSRTLNNPIDGKEVQSYASMNNFSQTSPSNLLRFQSPMGANSKSIIPHTFQSPSSPFNFWDNSSEKAKAMFMSRSPEDRLRDRANGEFSITQEPKMASLSKNSVPYSMPLFGTKDKTPLLNSIYQNIPNPNIISPLQGKQTIKENRDLFTDSDSEFDFGNVKAEIKPSKLKETTNIPNNSLAGQTKSTYYRENVAVSKTNPSSSSSSFKKINSGY